MHKRYNDAMNGEREVNMAYLDNIRDMCWMYWMYCNGLNIMFCRKEA